MLDLFTIRENIYNLRIFESCYEKKKTIRYGTETYGTVTYKAAQWWELLPYDTKNSLTLIEFKEKTYLKNIGYIDITNIFSMT